MSTSNIWYMCRRVWFLKGNLVYFYKTRDKHLLAKKWTTISICSQPVFPGTSLVVEAEGGSARSTPALANTISYLPSSVKTSRKCLPPSPPSQVPKFKFHVLWWLDICTLPLHCSRGCGQWNERAEMKEHIGYQRYQGASLSLINLSSLMTLSQWGGVPPSASLAM